MTVLRTSITRTACLVWIFACGAPGAAAQLSGSSVTESAEREVAEWVLRQGGELVLHGRQDRIRDLNKLPAEPFRIHMINFVDIHASSEDLERFGNLADLRRLYVSSRIQIGGRQRGARGEGGAPWRFLERLENLETFVNSEPVISSPVQIDDAALERIGAPEKLLELRVTRTAVKGTTLGIFRNLRHLDLSYSQLTDEGMKQLAGLEHLVTLNLHDTVITDAGLQYLSGLKQLQELDLHGANVTDEGLRHLAGLAELRKLTLLGTRISDESATALSQLTRLEELNLYATRIGNMSVGALRAIGSLRNLDLRYSQVTRAGVDALQKALPECSIQFQDGGVAASTDRPRPAAVTSERDARKWIEQIGGRVVAGPDGRVRQVILAATTVTDPELAFLQHFSRLDTLDLSGTQISDLGTSSLARLTSLTEIRLNDTAVGDATLPFLGRLKNLGKLSLANTRVRGSRMADLKSLGSLTHLDLSGAPLESEALEHIGAFTQLTDLSLSYTNIGDEGMAYLEPLTALERLDLTGVDLTDKGLVVLRKLTNIRVLSLRHVRLTNAGLENVAALKGLTDLDLSTSSQYSRLRDPGIQLLASLTSLKKLNLDYNPVTDAGLEQLSSLANLEELRLNTADITDAGLVHLKKLSKLRFLDLYHTLVTEQGFKDLKSALPQCKFVWELDSSFERRRKS